MSSEIYILLRHKIEEKVKQIEIYRKHMESDDLGDIEKESYRIIIENLKKDIERYKESYKAGKSFKYSKDDVRLSPDGVSKGKDMSDESETYRGDDIGHGTSITDPELERDTPDEEVSKSHGETKIVPPHDAYSVRDDYRELFDMDDTYEDTLLSVWDDMAEWMNDNPHTHIIEEEPEPIIDDSVIGKLKASVDVPEEFKFTDDMTFYTMLRNIFRGKNILVTGPSGCGKSSLGKILAEITNKPFYSFNFGDTMNPSAKILGDTKFSKEEGTWFKPSRFVSAITDNSGAFIMLDEITRDRTGDLANILMPVLDGQKYLALDESEDADMVNLDSGAFFYATANIGREYLGCAHDLDRAWKDRFCGGLYELEYLPQKKEQELLSVRVPQIKEDDARRITEFAKKIRDLYKAEELNVAVSTRMCLTSAELVVDGMSLLDALKHTVLPFYPVQGGDDTERVKVIQAIQSMGD
jgi:MoxR-like ATPase